MKIIDCPICLTSPGFVMVRKDAYETKYHCTCRNGDIHRYDGQECSKYKSYYKCSSIDTLPSGIVDGIIADNSKRYGIYKTAGRWYKPEDPNLNADQIAEMKAMAWAMMKINL